MSKLARIAFACVIVTSSNLVLAQQHCTNLASVLREYEVNTASSSYLNTVYDQHCQQSGSSSGTSVGLGLDAIVKSIPLKFTGSFSNTKEGFDNFCKTYQAVRAGTTTIDHRAERISSKALDTIRACYEIAATGVAIRHEVPSFQSVSFYMQNGPATKIEIRGLQAVPRDTVRCEGMIGSSLKVVNESTLIKVNPTQSITCIRKPNVRPDGSKVFVEQTITLHSNVGTNYTVYMPEEQKLPESIAFKLQNQIAALDNRNALLAATLNSEQASNRYTFVKSDEGCPSGWTSLGLAGWLIEGGAATNSLGAGGLYNSGWVWQHPRVCRRN